MVYKLTGSAQPFPTAHAPQYANFFSILARRQAIDKEIPTMPMHFRFCGQKNPRSVNPMRRGFQESSDLRPIVSLASLSMRSPKALCTRMGMLHFGPSAAA